MEFIDLIVVIIIALSLIGIIVFYIYKAIILPHRLDSVKELMEKKRYNEAIVSLTYALKKNDNDPELHYMLAECHYALENYESALLEYRQIASSSKYFNTPEEIKIRERMADIYIKINQPDEAQKEYALLSQKNPNNPEYLYQIGRIFFEKNNREQALVYLDKALKAGKIDANLYFMLGKIYFDSSKTGEAMSALTNCVKLSPKHHEAHFYLGLLLKATNNLGKATQEFDVAETSKDQILKAKAIYQKALCKMEVGEYTGAKIDLDRALKYGAGDINITVACRYALGLIYEQERKLIEAVEQWEKVAQIKPNYQDVAAKLEQYQDLRGDDKLKDLMTSTPSTFESICQDIIRTLGYDILESKIEGDDKVIIVGNEKASKWRDMKGGKILAVINRSNEDINDKQIIEIIEQMKSMHGVRAIYITTGRFTPQAIRYSENRPIDLYDKQKLNGILKGEASS